MTLRERRVSEGYLRGMGSSAAARHSWWPGGTGARPPAAGDGGYINFRGTFGFNVERYADVLVERAAGKGAAKSGQ